MMKRKARLFGRASQSLSDHLAEKNAGTEHRVERLQRDRELALQKLKRLSEVKVDVEQMDFDTTKFDQCLANCKKGSRPTIIDDGQVMSISCKCCDDLPINSKSPWDLVKMWNRQNLFRGLHEVDVPIYDLLDPVLTREEKLHNAYCRQEKFRAILDLWEIDKELNNKSVKLQHINLYDMMTWNSFAIEIMENKLKQVS